jgi:hypothetical protein
MGIRRSSADSIVRRFSMSQIGRHAIGLAIAVAATLPLAASSVVAQDADTVRGQCITNVMKAYPNTNPESLDGRARVELYITCMRQHGLQP